MRAALALALLIAAAPAWAERVRVLCNEDGSVAVLHAPDVAAEYVRLGEKRKFFDVDAANLPDREDRDRWRWKTSRRKRILVVEPGESDREALIRISREIETEQLKTAPDFQRILQLQADAAKARARIRARDEAAGLR